MKGYVKTKEEAKQKRREMQSETHEAHYVKLLFDRGYHVYSYPRGLLKKKCADQHKEKGSSKEDST